MNYVSVCSGIGGIDLGLDRAGMTPILQCENNRDAIRVLDRHWPDVPKHPDLTQLTGKDINGRVDIVCGGTPCQDISVAGNRDGLAGEQSRLFFDFMRLVDETTPTWVLWENVPGLLSSNGGRDMGTVLGSLADLGYGYAWRVLDAQYFGVAQRRRRVFVIGCARGRADRAAKVLFEPDSCQGDPAPSRQAGTRVAALTADGVGTCGADDNQAQAGHLVPTLTARYGKGTDSDASDALLPLAFMWQAAGNNSASGAFEENFTPTLPSSQTVAIAIPMRAAGAVGANGCGIGRQGDPALTLDTTGDMAVAHSTLTPQMQVRRLTPLECERLQGFPDGWTDILTDSARYRCLGNAVCVPVAEWIGRRIARDCG